MRWAALALLPAAAGAQEPCAGLWEMVEGWGRAGLVAPVEADAVGPAEDGWCEAAGVRAALGGGGSVVPTVLADRLRWRGEGLDAVLAGTGLPTAIEVEADGLRQLTVTGEPVLDWAFEAQGRPHGIEARLAARKQRAAKRLSARIATAQHTAMAQRGDAYSYGSAGPNAFDCSGLVF